MNRTRLLGFALASRFGFAVLVAQYSLARQLDLVALAADAFHQDLLSFLQLVAHVFHSSIGNLRNVQQAVSAREDLNERAEIDDSRNRAEIRLTDFRFSGQTTNTIHGCVRGFATRSSD